MSVDTMTYYDYTSLASTPDKRVTSLHFYVTPPTEPYGHETLLPVPLSFNFVENLSEPDQSKWQAYNFVYCYQGPYGTAEQLADAFDNGELTLCRVQTRNLEWSNTDTKLPIRPGSRVLGPRSYSPAGRRFVVKSSGSRDDAADSGANESSGNGGTRHRRRRRRLVRQGHKVQHQRLKRADLPTESWKRGRPGRELASLTTTVGVFEDRDSGDGDKANTEHNKNVDFRLGDGTGHIVSWLGWSFHVSVDQYHGMVVRDLAFKGERVAYELSFQEYSSSYSSAGSNVAEFYFDSNYEIGTRMYGLQPGVDCPVDALYLPILLQKYQGLGYTEPGYLCVFEQSMGESLWRHAYRANSGTFHHDGNYIGGIDRTALQIRVISTIGNYDYLPTLSLYPDGEVHLGVKLAGYVSGSYSFTDSTKGNRESPLFATKVQKALNADLHDHLIAIKADVDVVDGTNNTLITGKISYGTYEQATGEREAPGWVAYDGFKYMNLTEVITETPLDVIEHDLIMVAGPTVNEWGERRAYEVHYDSSVRRQVYPWPNHPIAAAQAWARTNLAVTRFKDLEQYCSYPSNFQVSKPFPRFDLSKFQEDGESTKEEDLVLWIMVGRQHYPKAEDVPLITNFGSGVWLKPRNMFDRAAFADLPDNRNVPVPECVPPNSG